VGDERCGWRWSDELVGDGDRLLFGSRVDECFLLTPRVLRRGCSGEDIE
jgi:hypothetical protein